MKNKPTMTKSESKLFVTAQKQLIKSPVLRKQSSATRRAWREGFVNGKLYHDHLKSKGKWYEFWK